MKAGGAFPEPVEKLITEFERLPGVGRRSAERMAFHILRSAPDDAMSLSRAIASIKQNVRPCGICFNLSHVNPCSICDDPRRDASTVLVVEQTKDLISLEETGIFHGVYHVLNGRLDPLAGVEPDSITLAELIARIDGAARNSRSTPVAEVILGLNPDMEGDSTALYVADQLAGRDVRISRLARGLPAGSQLEYVSKAVLTDAIEGRRSLDG